MQMLIELCVEKWECVNIHVYKPVFAAGPSNNVNITYIVNTLLDLIAWNESFPRNLATKIYHNITEKITEYDFLFFYNLQYNLQFQR